MISNVRAVTHSSSELGGYGQDAASYLGLAGLGHGVLADFDAAHLHHFTVAELSEVQTSLFHLDFLHELHGHFTLHHGNWCGPGNTGTVEVDAMDGFCHVHDNAYDALGVTSGDNGVSMWSRAGLKATVEADEALVHSVSQLTGLDGDAEWYRDNIIRIFSARARLGHLLRRLSF